jgi:hypothetical protein
MLSRLLKGLKKARTYPKPLEIEYVGYLVVKLPGLGSLHQAITMFPSSPPFHITLTGKLF